MKRFCDSDPIRKWPKNGMSLELCCLLCVERASHLSIHYRCVFNGVLPDEEAEKLNKVILKRKKQMKSGVASPSPAKRKKKKKAKVIKEEADDVDMQAAGADRVGSAVL